MIDSVQDPAAPLLVEQDGGVVTLTLNDAPWNRMSLEFMDELDAVVDKLAEDNSVRAVVLTSARDENFSVGMNLKQVATKFGSKKDFLPVLDQRLRVLSTIETMGKPFIATLFGYCLGGGLELPLACHFRLAAEEGAQIGLPELDLGTVPAWGGSARLVRCVGRMYALDMILRARMISGSEAYRIGLVTEVVPNNDLKARAHELAHELAAMPPLSVAEMIRCIVETGDRPLHEGLHEERLAVMRTSGTKDNQEGMMAFLEKRKPVFTGE
jgi:enoyl-CoA hydratase